MSGQQTGHVAAYEAIIERFTGWARAESTIEAAMIIGSRARFDHPADAWSDLDIVIFTADPRRILGESDWLTAIGPPVITYIEPTAVGSWQERRVLFEGALDVDFAAVPAELLAQLEDLVPEDALYEELASVIRRGYRILIDKESRLAPLLVRMATPVETVTSPPGQDELTETLNDFWYQCVWLTKKLRRGELIAAHECLRGHQHWLLMRLIRWHAERHGPAWHRSRFLEEWADPYVAEELPATWATHDTIDIQRALTSMMDLVAWLAHEIAATYNLRIPLGSEIAARRWITELSST
jgi:aminoglycoside 6-adenylyltransferase